jgi:hypothetical protein
VTLSMNPAEREVSHHRCDCCQAPVEQVRNRVRRDGTVIALFFADCFHHRPGVRPEVVVDVVLGTRDRLDHPDHVTFAARFREVDQSSLHPAFQLVPPVHGRSGAPVDGRVPQPDEAGVHPRFPEFLEVVEFVVLHDTAITLHLYGS